MCRRVMNTYKTCNNLGVNFSLSNFFSCAIIFFFFLIYFSFHLSLTLSRWYKKSKGKVSNICRYSSIVLVEDNAVCDLEHWILADNATQLLTKVAKVFRRRQSDPDELLFLEIWFIVFSYSLMPQDIDLYIQINRTILNPTINHKRRWIRCDL